MSGIFSIASHWALQNLPDVTRQEQTGWAHFAALGVSILILLALFQLKASQNTSLVIGREGCCRISHKVQLGP